MPNGRMIKVGLDLHIVIRIIAIQEVWLIIVILSLIMEKIVESYFRMKRNLVARANKEYKWEIILVLVRKVIIVRLRMLH